LLFALLEHLGLVLAADGIVESDVYGLDVVDDSLGLGARLG
jgi:hypothetical protein